MATPPDRGALIGPGFYNEIKNAIDRVGAMPYDATKITRIPVDLSGDPQMPSQASPTFRIGTFTGTWSIGTEKVVTLVSDTNSTVLATNVFAGLIPGAGCSVAIARDGAAWKCISANLAGLQGYSQSGTQVLSMSGGNLRWIETTAC